MQKLSLLLITTFFVTTLLAQNVGIGTNAPSEKLHVVGNARADTLKTNGLRITPNAGAGKVLTSDAAGNATWRTAAVVANAGYGVWGDCAANGNIGNYQPVADTISQTLGFGKAVSISGDFAVIGNLYENINANANQGSASIYLFNGTTWDFFQKITDPTGSTGNNFGASVCINGNVLLVGSPNDDIGANLSEGSVCFFRYSNGSWSYISRITDPGGAVYDQFGTSLAVSGNLAIIGSPWDDNGASADRGSASFFRANGNSWTFMNKVVDPDGGTNDTFGAAVSISGEYAVVGSPLDDGEFVNQGSVTVYRYNGSSSFLRIAKITDNFTTGSDQFGNSVANLGSDILVGAPTYESSTGRVHQFRNNNGTFTRAISYDPPTAGTFLQFGTSIAVSGNYMLIGSPGRDYGGEQTRGEAVLYQRVGNYYNRMQVIRDPGGAEYAGFGNPVAIDGEAKYFLIGNENGGSVSSGAKAVFGSIN